MRDMLLEYRRVAYEEDRIVASDRSLFDDCDDVIIKQSSDDRMNWVYLPLVTWTRGLSWGLPRKNLKTKED